MDKNFSKEINHIKDSSNFILKQTSNLNDIFKNNKIPQKENDTFKNQKIPSHESMSSNNVASKNIQDINNLNIEKIVSIDDNIKKVEPPEPQNYTLLEKTKP